jgi:hypothetical protein
LDSTQYAVLHGLTDKEDIFLGAKCKAGRMGKAVEDNGLKVLA